MPEKFLDDNPCLFAADPFLLLLCVLTSPIEEYSKLINKVPLFMLLTAMIEKVNFRNAQKVSINSSLPTSIIVCILLATV